jgi:hypothetical protein
MAQNGKTFWQRSLLDRISVTGEDKPIGKSQNGSGLFLSGEALAGKMVRKNVMSFHRDDTAGGYLLFRSTEALCQAQCEESQNGRFGKYPTKWTDLARKPETLPRILSTGTNFPGQTRFSSGFFH